MTGIVIVNYKSSQDTISYINDEVSKLTGDYKIVIVDNSCDSESCQCLATQLKATLVDINSLKQANIQNKIFVVDADDNLGYAKGNNLGADFLNQNFEPESILFSNNDIKIIDRNLLAVLNEALTKNASIGVIGPRVLSSDNKDQNPSDYASIWKKYIIPWLLYPVLFPLINSGRLKDVVYNSASGFYYRVSGCFMLVRTSAFIQAGKFDPHTFLYAEEEILSERMLKAGFKTYYCKETSVVHNHGTVTKKFIAARSGFELSFDSELYYYMNYRNINKAEVALAKLSKIIFLNLYLPVIKLTGKTLKLMKLKSGK